MSQGALDGIVVADFTRVLAGPYATMMLADMGAEVVKIERPGTGDDTRAWGPPYDDAGSATYFNSVNRNKTSVVLDLASEQGRAEARRIVARADIVVENFRAGTMERLGLGYDDLLDVNPGLIYCSVTGFGSGDGAALPGYDLLVQAVGGLMSITGPEAGTPTKVGVAVVDVLTGLHALAGILAALHHRQRTGEGQRVETNLLAALLSSLVNQGSAYLGAGVVPGILGNRHPSIAPYEVFPTKDRPLALAVGNDKQFTRSPPRRSARRNWPPTRGSAATRCGSHTARNCARRSPRSSRRPGPTTGTTNSPAWVFRPDPSTTSPRPSSSRGDSVSTPSCRCPEVPHRRSETR